jgi:hypothetical protein
MTEQLPQQKTPATKTLEIPGVSEEQIRQLDERARQAGTDRGEFVKRLIARELDTPTIDEIFAPFRQAVAESGITDEELTALFEEARDEVWEEWKRKGKA